MRLADAPVGVPIKENLFLVDYKWNEWLSKVTNRTDSFYIILTNHLHHIYGFLEFF